MEKDTVFGLLGKASLFRGLPGEACRRLARTSRGRCLARREILFHEGQQGEDLYLLESGKIQLCKNAPDGGVVVVKTVPAGEVFAEVILFESRAYPVTAEALCKTRVQAISRREILRELENPEFRDAWIRMLLARQRYLAERVRILSAYDVEERFCLFLLEQYGARSRIEIDISKQAIAAAVGATPETFSRMLGRLKGEGMAWWEEGKTLRATERFWERHRALLQESRPTSSPNMNPAPFASPA